MCFVLASSEVTGPTHAVAGVHVRAGGARAGRQNEVRAWGSLLFSGWRRAFSYPYLT